MSYCELSIWKKINKVSKRVYHKFRLADCLRVCNYLSESEKVFLTIDVNKIPKKSRNQFYDCLGLLYDAMHRYDDALNAFNESLKLSKKYSWTYVFISAVYKMKENDLDAIKYLNKALKKDQPVIDEIYYNLATSYLRLGKYKKALNCINACLSIDKNYVDAEKTKSDIVELLKKKLSNK